MFGRQLRRITVFNRGIAMYFSKINGELFETALYDAGYRQKDGIGTLSEKILHAALKNYFADHDGSKEIKVGKYVADVLHGDRIYEIQTCGGAPLKRKVGELLASHKVSVVFPIMRKKTLFWVDPKSGEVSTGRKSPKTGKYSDALPEIFYLSEYIGNENFGVILFLYDGREYKRLDGFGNGGKRGAHREERIPERAIEMLTLENASDLAALLPNELPEEFSKKEFSRITGLQGRNLWAALKLLCEKGILSSYKEGRSFCYVKVGATNEKAAQENTVQEKAAQEKAAE